MPKRTPRKQEQFVTKEALGELLTDQTSVILKAMEEGFESQDKRIEERFTAQNIALAAAMDSLWGVRTGFGRRQGILGRVIGIRWSHVALHFHLQSDREVPRGRRDRVQPAFRKIQTTAGRAHPLQTWCVPA